MLEGKDLHIQVYHQEMGFLPPHLDRTDPCVWVPQPFHVEWEKEGVDFLLRCDATRNRVETSLQECNATLQLPDPPQALFTVSCTLEPAMWNFYNLATTWEPEVTDTITPILGDITWKTIAVNRDVWPDFISKALPVLEEIQQGEGVFTVCADQQYVYVCGKRAHMMKHIATLKRMKKDLENENTKLLQIVEKDGHTLQHYQMTLLHKSDFIGQMHAKYKDLQLREQKDLRFWFRGMPDDVQAAMEEMLEQALSIRTEVVEMSGAKMELLKTQHTQRYLEEYMQGLVMMWETNEDKGHVTLYTMTQSALDQMREFMTEKIKEFEMALDADQKAVVLSNMWRTFVSQLSLEHEGHLVMHAHDGMNILIACRGNLMNNIRGAVTEFMEDNIMSEMSVPVEYGQATLLKSHLKHRLEEIEDSMSKFSVEIRVHTSRSRPGLVINGAKVRLHECHDKIQRVCEGIIVEKHCITTPGMHKYFLTTGLEQLEAIEKKHRVFADFSNRKSSKRVQESVGSCHDRVGTTVDQGRRAEVRVSPEQTLRVLMGDLLQCHVDAIVVSGPTGTMEYRSGLGAAIIKEGQR